MYSGNDLLFFLNDNIRKEYELLQVNIQKKLNNLGFSNSYQTLNNMQNKLVDKSEYNLLSNKDKNNIQLNILKIIDRNLVFLECNEDFLSVVNIMTAKTKKFSCESVLKLALFCHDKKTIKKIYQEIQESILSTFTNLSNKLAITLEELHKIFGYILVLNFNKYSYLKISFFSFQKINPFNIREKVNNHLSIYAEFIKANHLAPFDPSYSTIRREILYKAQLLETHLQRDPEEVEIYDAQMAASQVDKDRLLSDIQAKAPNDGVVIIDIGPAGGATFKSVLMMAYNYDSTKIGYYGIEYDRNELINLNELLNNYTYNELTHKQLISFAHFVEGNALDLSNNINAIKKINEKIENKFLSIVLSSVIHEIYSYCPYDMPMTNTIDVTTMSKVINSQYNPETIYKIYYEGLKTIAEHTGGGSLNIRDGVMYKDPDEMITFTLNNSSWVKLFIEFLNDKKYKHLQHQIDIGNIVVGKEITLQANYVQEFMLKANWGPESFGNEINEIYCYLKLKDHILLLKRAADNLNINITIPIKIQYTQPGYTKHIDQSKISILSGFNKNKGFPPTNMVLKVEVNKNNIK